MPLLRFIIIISFVTLFGGTSQAACVSGAPNGSSLDIYGDPLSSRPVIGGVAVGQCTLEVTPTCSGDFCQVFLGTLSGWADMRFVSVAASEPKVSEFIYEIKDGSGSVTFLGRTQPTPVTPGGRVKFTLLNDGTMRLTLPRESQMPDVIMQRTGSSSFTGSMPNWGGFPVTVEVIAEPVSAPRVILDFFANSPQVKMQISMNLVRTNSPNLTTSNNQQANQSSNNADSPTCLLAADVSATIGILERSPAQTVYQQILDRVGIDFNSPTEDQCRSVLDASLNEGVLCELVNKVGLPPNFSWGPVRINANGGTIERIPAEFCALYQPSGRGQPGTTEIKKPGPSNTQAQNTQNAPTQTTSNSSSSAVCDVLLALISPILREQSGSTRRNDLMSVLKSVGVFDLANATPGECRQIGIDLTRAGLIAEGSIDLNGSNSQQGGEDPKTMIEGGVEIPGSEQDFVPRTQSGEQNANAQTSIQQNQASASGKKQACMAFADTVLEIVSFGSTADISILQIVLATNNMTKISDKTDQQCKEAFGKLQQRGLVR
ncbi:MAG: hypothetical protein AAGF54_08870 [Pseudomonadota bacterium]